MDSMRFFLVKSHSVSRMRTRGSATDATRSRVSSFDLPTLTTTSSHTASTDRIAGTIGKSSLTALRTRVKPDSTSGAELEIVQPAVQAVRGQQVAVRAALDDPPLRQHDDEVGVLHGREAVRDDEHRAVRHEPLDRLLHQPLGLGVERAGGLIENEDRWIAEQCPGNRDPLALATGKPRAALAQERAIALGEEPDEVVRVGRARRGTHLVERHILQAVGDI